MKLEFIQCKYSFFFFGAQYVFGLFILIPEQCSLPSVFWPFGSCLQTKYNYAIISFHNFVGLFFVMFNIFGLHVTCSFARIFFCLFLFVGT